MRSFEPILSTFGYGFGIKMMKNFQKFFEIFFFKNQNKADFSPFKAIFGRFRYGFGIKMMKIFQKFFEIFFSKIKTNLILGCFSPFLAVLGMVLV